MIDVHGRRPGEEITIEYTSGLVQKTKAEREAVLKEKFGFACGCPLCASDSVHIEASDARRRELGRLVNHIEAVGARGQRSEVVKDLSRIREILQEEGYVASGLMPFIGFCQLYHAYDFLVQRQCPSSLR